jgi:hypothetical protein
MVDKDLGEATIVYEDPDDGTVEMQVENEHVAYFQDHWVIKRDEHETGQDLVRRIPAYRVYYVERSVEEFEEEVQTLTTQVQSLAEDLRQRVLGSDGGRRRRARRTEGGEEAVRIDVERGGESAGTAAGSTSGSTGTRTSGSTGSGTSGSSSGSSGSSGSSTSE